MELQRYFKTIIMTAIVFTFLFSLRMNTVVQAEEKLRYTCSAQVYEAFENERLDAFTGDTGIKVELHVTSSSAAMGLLMRDYSDVASTTERLYYNHEEYGYKETPFCTDSLAVITHPGTGVGNLQKEDLNKIFKREITNWKQVGGNDLPVVLVVPGEKTGAYLNFVQTVMNRKDLKYDYMAYKSTNVIETVKLIPGSISFISYGALSSHKGLNILKIDNFPPSDHENYTLVQAFSFVTRGEPKGPVKAFIDFAMSDKGMDIIAKRGMTPVR